MAESREDPEVHWVDPSLRGTLPIEGFHISRSLRKTILSERYSSHFNRDFEDVVRCCADRDETWINDTIFDLYVELHNEGHAHSQEIWHGDDLVGGVYGVAIGGAFFGESMFSRQRDTSKLALAYLVDRLKQTGFVLFDTQFITAHLATLGAKEISRNDYLDQLEKAISLPADITNLAGPQSGQDVIQRSAQTS